MKRKSLSGTSILHTAAICILLAAPALAGTLHVGPGQPYATIQSAVDAAFPGDEILVHDGVYVENVLVDKAVAVRAQSWVTSSHNDAAIIDAGMAGDEDGFKVTAAGAAVEGFSIFNAIGYTPEFYYRSAIAVRGAAGTVVAHNRCGWDDDHKNSINITISESSSCEILENSTREGQHGIFVEDSADCLIQGNDCRDHTLGSNSAGVYMYGGTDMYTGEFYTRDNLILDNEFRGCVIGVHLQSGCKGVTVADNVADENYAGIAANGGAFNCAILDNLIRDNGHRGVWLNGSRENVVAGNTIDATVNGIWLGYQSPSDYGCDNTVITMNSITNCTYAGIRISAKSDNARMSLNSFAGNANHVVSEGTDWSTATPVSYFHGANFSGQLGNYYDTYTGADLDGDGVGDEGLPFIDGDPDYGPVENHPLVAPPGDYVIQAWYLDGDEGPTMRCGDAGSVPGEMGIDHEAVVVWLSDHPAVGEVSFAAGAWTGQLSFNDAPMPDAFTVEIGHSSDGTDFTPSGAQASVGGDWNNPFTTSAASVTVPDRRCLALRLTSAAGWTIPLRTGGMWSYVSSPGLGDPDWPHGTGTDVPGAPAAGLVLRQNAPNPFNPRTVILFDLPAPSAVRLRVHDLAGRLVRTLVDRPLLPAGPQRATWNGRDAAGRHVAAGAYLYRLEAGGKTVSRRMTLVR